ncbi:MAG: hypothetical protein IPM83_15710 [Ignavibacteria bacterium]|nr:hypothetical protein [Ignavibacteria bacterium]
MSSTLFVGEFVKVQIVATKVYEVVVIGRGAGLKDLLGFFNIVFEDEELKAVGLVFLDLMIDTCFAKLRGKELRFHLVFECR